MNIDQAQQAYQSDVMFRQLVDLMMIGIQKMDYTPSELRSAAMYASIRFEQARPSRRLVVSEEEYRGFKKGL